MASTLPTPKAGTPRGKTTGSDTSKKAISSVSPKKSTPKPTISKNTNRTSSTLPTTKKSLTPKKSTAKKSIQTKTSTSPITSNVVRSTLPLPPRRQQSSSGSGWMWLVLLILIVLVGWGTQDTWKSYLPSSDRTSTLISMDGLFVGKDVALSGTISQYNQRNATYTHMIQTTQYESVGIRSTRVVLGDFAGEVQVTGRIVDLIGDVYIMDVQSVISLSLPDDELLYFAQPGLLVKNFASQGFVVDSDDKAISFVNTITNSKIIVRYFQCNDTQAQNCNLFAESFQKNGLPYVRDKYNNMYYKLNDQNTWFVQLDDNYGVYIETNDEALFSLFVQNSQFITRQRATLELQQQAKSLCVQENQQLKDITKSILETQDKSVRWTVEGTSAQYNSVNCILSLDPLDYTTIKLEDMTYTIGDSGSEDIIDTTSETDSTPQDITTDISGDMSTISVSNIAQFPLRPGKELSFSTRGMTILFPSPNIAFASSNISTSLVGMNCTVVTNVIEYTKRDDLTINPSIEMYFCTGSHSSLGNDMRLIERGDQKILIKVIDPAWVNFANAIVIQ